MDMWTYFLKYQGCFICHNYIRETINCKTCHKGFCKYCITNYINTESDMCPNCFTQFAADKIDEANMQSR